MRAVYVSILRVTAICAFLALGAASEELAAEELLFDSLLHGTDSQLDIQTAQSILFSSQQELEAFWSNVPSWLTSDDLSPDYANVVLLGVFLSGSGASSLDIKKVRLKDELTLIVNATSNNPPSGCAVLTALTMPFHVIALKRDELPTTQLPVKLILEEKIWGSCN